MLTSDHYVEYAFRAKPDGAFYIRMAIAIWVIFMGIPILLFVGGLGIIVSILGVCLLCCFRGYGNVEYEYTLTNGSVEIATIYNASKRKEQMHFEMDQVSMIVPENSPRIQHETVVRRRKFVSGRKEAQCISMLLELNGKKEIVTMEVDERCMEHIRAYAKEKIYDCQAGWRE